MAWGSKQTATQLTSITSEQFFDEEPQINEGELAHVQITVDFPGSPTDDALVKVYGTLDDATETWDNVELMGFTVENSNDPANVSFIVRGVYKFRVGVQRDGSTDTLTDADMAYRIAPAP